MTTEDIVRRLNAQPTAKPDAWLAKCVAHDDHNASLSISKGADGRILLYCHAGCTVDAILGAIGLTSADLFAVASAKVRVPQIVATYDYADEDGKLLFQAVRFKPKAFRQRRPDRARPGEWVWNLDGVPRVPYQLPGLLAACEDGRTIFIVEGEKDCDTLAKEKFVATCNPMGAGKWLPEFAQYFRDAARVVIIPDKDTPGRMHAEAVAVSLLGVAKVVKVLELPDREDKTVKDISDWFAAGGTDVELKALVEAAPAWPLPEHRRKPGTLAAEYLPSSAEKDQGEPEADPKFDAPEWPAPLAPAAFHGLAGEVVRTIEPHSEADPAALLIMFLSAFGNLAGAAAHFLAEARRHPARIWAVLVGQTAKGRKGSAWSSLCFILAMLDEVWAKNCNASGLSSAEGVIYRVRDAAGEDEGVSDKRLHVTEEEFGSLLKVAGREGNTISDLLRRAWDHGDLQTMTKNSPCHATGAHVTVTGHITKPDLSRLLSETDSVNGFGNRFLWLAVRRSKLLPEGGALHKENLAPLIFRLRQSLDFARQTGLVERSGTARELWRDIYPTLTSDKPGILGAITNRAEAQTMRLALAYALLNRSPKIEVIHLQAALAVWDFCERSARFIFGEALGDKIADRILDELRHAGPLGMTRNSIRDIFKGNVAAGKLDAALAMLRSLNLTTWSKEHRPGAGRPAVYWRAIPKVEQPREVQPDDAGRVPALPAPFPKDETPVEEVAAIL